MKATHKATFFILILMIPVLLHNSDRTYLIYHKIEKK